MVCGKEAQYSEIIATSANQIVLPKFHGPTKQTIWTNSENNTSKAKKLSCGSHSFSVNYGNTFANCCNTFAYFRVTHNTFGVT